MKMYNIYKNLDNVKFLHVESHTGKNEIHSIGNDYADKLARSSISQNDNVREGVTRIYLSVPYICKNQIKSWGGQWDYKKKKWYILKQLKQPQQQREEGGEVHGSDRFEMDRRRSAAAAVRGKLRGKEWCRCANPKNVL